MTVKSGIPVIFRKWPKSADIGAAGSDVIALFPTLPGNTSPYTMESYEHVGQHGAASIDVIGGTEPAKPAEYADLMKELHQIGYRNLVVYSRHQNEWTEMRRQQLMAHDRGEKAAKTTYTVTTRKDRKSKSRKSRQSGLLVMPR